MKKEVIMVKKGQDPWEVLQENAERINTSWCFIHKNVYEVLLESCSKHYATNNMNEYKSAFLKWNVCDGDKKNYLGLFVNVPQRVWGKVTAIDIRPSYFKAPHDPEEIFFIKMETEATE